MVPPGDAASPFFPTEPAVPAPCVLGSLEEGMELPVVVAGVPSFFMAGPPPVVLPFMLSPVVVFDPAGPPAFESRLRCSEIGRMTWCLRVPRSLPVRRSI
jgi:hypothetical protein